MDILIYLHEILISIKWESMYFLGWLGGTKNGQVFKEFSIQLMKFTFKVEIFQKLCWYLISLNTIWIPCRKNYKLIFLHSGFIYGTCHIVNVGVQIHIIYINLFESFLLNLTMNMHGQYFVITLKKTNMPIIDQSLWRTNQNPITSFSLTFEIERSLFLVHIYKSKLSNSHW
jgi:hypothetical protein